MCVFYDTPFAADTQRGLSVLELEKAVRAATDMLLQYDSYLLKADANERSLSHHLAMYLAHQFPGLDIDCEYNRDETEPKRLPRPALEPNCCDTDARTVYPDIIVHRRGTNDDNLLVIEIKKTSNHDNREHDRKKLRAYRSHLGYQYALLLELEVGSRPGIAMVEWI